MRGETAEKGKFLLNDKKWNSSPEQPLPPTPLWSAVHGDQAPAFHSRPLLSLWPAEPHGTCSNSWLNSHLRWRHEQIPDLWPVRQPPLYLLTRPPPGSSPRARGSDRIPSSLKPGRRCGNASFPGNAAESENQIVAPLTGRPCQWQECWRHHFLLISVCKIHSHIRLLTSSQSDGFREDQAPTERW